MNIFVKKLKKDYGSRRVLEVETLSIQKGSLCGIIGPNGAGKSTLIKILGGLEDATGGEIFYNGLKGTPELSKHMTVVFQKPYLLRTTVFQNIAYPLTLRGLDKKKIQDKVHNIIEEMEIEELIERKAWTLSGGEAQKVALARALVFQPSILLLDEPTANIDPASMAVMETMIRKVNEEEGTTIVMVTHNIQQAKRVCKEILFMDAGKIEEHGEIEDVIYYSKNEKTQRFIRGEIIV